jgi:two-component system nitrogen regulation response regulator NtrX
LSEQAQPLIGSGAAIRAIDREIDYAARIDAKVLITGESGVGKEIIARLVHERSRRGRTPLVAVNCAGIPDALLESALFGHVKGSFTDAHRDRLGLLELAHRGTIFLDEIGEMSLRMQALLLRFLEHGEIQRVGADRLLARVDVRVLAATNRNLLDRIASKDFREDLYYRINVIHIPIPPLRARREDIPVFIRFFLQSYAERHGGPEPELAPDAFDQLVSYDWPGNVRELKNAIERLVVRRSSGVIAVSDLPAEIRRPIRRTGGGPTVADALFERMTNDHESFWSAVHEVFLARDLTRADLRAIMRRGLAQTGGNYKALVPLFNMRSGDYRRFLGFLRKHDCYERVERARPATVADESLRLKSYDG